VLKIILPVQFSTVQFTRCKQSLTHVSVSCWCGCPSKRKLSAAAALQLAAESSGYLISADINTVGGCVWHVLTFPAVFAILAVRGELLWRRRRFTMLSRTAFVLARSRSEMVVGARRRRGLTVSSSVRRPSSATRRRRRRWQRCQ